MSESTMTGSNMTKSTVTESKITRSKITQFWRAKSNLTPFHDSPVKNDSVQRAKSKPKHSGRLIW